MTTFQKGDRVHVRPDVSSSHRGRQGTISQASDDNGRFRVSIPGKQLICPSDVHLWFDAEELELIVTEFQKGDRVNVRNTAGNVHFRGKPGVIDDVQSTNGRWPVLMDDWVSPTVNRPIKLWFDANNLELADAEEPETVTVATFNTNGAVPRMGRNVNRTPEEIRAWSAVEALVPILKDPELEECALRPVRAALYSLVLEAVAAGTPDAAELAAEALGRP